MASQTIPFLCCFLAAGYCMYIFFRGHRSQSKDTIKRVIKKHLWNATHGSPVYQLLLLSGPVRRSIHRNYKNYNTREILFLISQVLSLVRHVANKQFTHEWWRLKPKRLAGAHRNSPRRCRRRPTTTTTTTIYFIFRFIFVLLFFSYFCISKKEIVIPSQQKNANKKRQQQQQEEDFQVFQQRFCRRKHFHFHSGKTSSSSSSTLHFKKCIKCLWNIFAKKKQQQNDRNINKRKNKIKICFNRETRKKVELFGAAVVFLLATKIKKNWKSRRQLLLLGFFVFELLEVQERIFILCLLALPDTKMKEKQSRNLLAILR